MKNIFVLILLKILTQSTAIEGKNIMSQLRESLQTPGTRPNEETFA